jgi:WD40 repeat protein
MPCTDTSFAGAELSVAPAVRCAANRGRPLPTLLALALVAGLAVPGCSRRPEVPRAPDGTPHTPLASAPATKPAHPPTPAPGGAGGPDWDDPPRAVTVLSWSPDGRHVLSACGGDPYLRFHDLATRRRRRDIPPASMRLTDRAGVAQPQVSAAAFAPDGRRFLTGTADGALKLWDFPSCRLVRSFASHGGRVVAVAFAADGRRALSASDDRSLVLWDVESGRAVRSLTGLDHRPEQVVFSPDGRLAAWVQPGERDGLDRIFLWDAAGKLLPPLQGHPTRVRQLAFSPDGGHLASAYADGKVWLWDISQRRPGLECDTGPNEPGPVSERGAWSVAFSPSGRYLLTGSQHGLCLWEVASSQAVLRAGRDLRTARHCAVSPDGRRVLAIHNSEWDDALVLWDLTTGEEVQTLEGPPPQGPELHDATFSPDGQLVAAAGAVLVQPRGTATEEPRKSAVVRLWDAGSGRHLRTLRVPGDEVRALAFRPGGRLVAATSERVWEYDAASGRRLRALAEPPSWQVSLAVSSDGRYMLLGGSQLQLWDLAAGKRLRDLHGSKPMFSEVVGFTPDGRLAVAWCGDGAGCRTWDVASGTCLRTFPGAGRGAILSPDGKSLLGLDGHLWDLAGGPARRLWRELRDADITAVAFAPDGRLVAAAHSVGEVTLRDVPEGRWVRTLVGRGMPIELTGGRGAIDLGRVAFSPDGRLVLAAGVGGRPKLWEVATGRERTLQAPPAGDCGG